MYLDNEDRNLYEQIMYELWKYHIKGINEYPHILTNAYKLMLNYNNINTNTNWCRKDLNDTGVVFSHNRGKWDTYNIKCCQWNNFVHFGWKYSYDELNKKPYGNVPPPQKTDTAPQQQTSGMVESGAQVFMNGIDFNNEYYLYNHDYKYYVLT